MALALTSELPPLRQSQFFNEKDAVMEQLSGFVDGSRRTFRTQEAPLIYDPTGLYGPIAPFTLYDANENTIPSSLWTLTNANEGTIQFKTAPQLGQAPLFPFYATFTWCDLSLTDLYGALLAGFYELEQRFYRGFQLVAITNSTTPLANQEDMMIVDRNGNDPQGPNGSVFSTSAVQLNYFRVCVAYKLTRNYLWSSSKRAYQYREGARGLEINPTSALKMQQVILTEVSAKMDQYLDAARAEWDSNNFGLGAGIVNPSSNGYNTMFSWLNHGSAGGYGGFSSGYSSW